jgi:hypothetical protein
MRRERSKIALDQRLCARDMRLLAWMEPARLANFRADQEAGEIFASVGLGDGAHERQRSRAKQEAKETGLPLAASTCMRCAATSLGPAGHRT